MIYLKHQPAAPLGLAVEAIWLYAGYQPPHRLERLLPSGTVEWVVNLREDRFRCYDPETFQLKDKLPGTLITGPRSRVQVIDTEQQAEVMGIHFRPGGMRYLCKVSAGEFAEQDVALEQLWGRCAMDLREQLILAPTPKAKILLLQRLLHERLSFDRPPHRAVPEALARLETGASPLKQSDLAAGLGLSHRRFIEVFTDSVGLSPKVYARLRRFQIALGVIHGTRGLDLADLAYDCGWYDQSHMIRDFKQFSGLTPLEYARLKGEHLLHVPVGEGGQICPIQLGATQ